MVPEQDCSFLDFTQVCLNYVNFNILTKQHTLSANTMFTAFTSLHKFFVKYLQNKPIRGITQSYNESHRLVLG